jgi:hypothetical protein
MTTPQPPVPHADLAQKVAMEAEFYRIAAALSCWRFGEHETKEAFATRVLERIDVSLAELRAFDRAVRLVLDLYPSRPS